MNVACLLNTCNVVCCLRSRARSKRLQLGKVTKNWQRTQHILWLPLQPSLTIHSFSGLEMSQPLKKGANGTETSSASLGEVLVEWMSKCCHWRSVISSPPPPVSQPSLIALYMVTSFPQALSLSILSYTWKSLSSVRLFATPWTIQSMEFSSQNTGMSSLLQGILPSQGLNPGPPKCR